MKFSNLPLIAPLQKALDKAWFVNATPIQEKVIPHAIEKKDIIGTAQTGSGKTFAFGLPILQNIYNDRIDKWWKEWKATRKIQALIIAPTRELAMQIWDSLKDFISNTNLKYTVIFGWVNQFHQVKAIEKWIDILISTPGRLEDFISQWIVKVSYVDYFVLDEADRMLDLGFLWDVKKIIKRIPEKKQSFLFSATMSPAIKELAQELLKNPEVIRVDPPESTTDKINQKVYHIKSSHKRKLLQQIVKRRDLKSILVFVRTRDDVELVTRFVKTAGVKCDNISKDKSQAGRLRALKWLKDWEIKVLVATDIASRWIDVNNLSCVINYNIPSDGEDYIHRIWRTARAGNEWLAISMCTETDTANFANIEKLIKQKITVVTDMSYLEEELSKELVNTKTVYKEEIKKVTKRGKSDKEKEEFYEVQKLKKKISKERTHKKEEKIKEEKQKIRKSLSRMKLPKEKKEKKSDFYWKWNDYKKQTKSSPKREDSRKKTSEKDFWVSEYFEKETKKKVAPKNKSPRKETSKPRISAKPTKSAPKRKSR